MSLSLFNPQVKREKIVRNVTTHRVLFIYDVEKDKKDKTTRW